MRIITKYPFYEVHFLKLGDVDAIIIAYKKSVDAENVIVANQDGINVKNLYGNKSQYINGALEETQPKRR